MLQICAAGPSLVQLLRPLLALPLYSSVYTVWVSPSFSSRSSTVMVMADSSAIWVIFWVLVQLLRPLLALP